MVRRIITFSTKIFVLCLMGIVISWLGIKTSLKAETMGQSFAETVSQSQQNPLLKKMVAQVSPSSSEPTPPPTESPPPPSPQAPSQPAPPVPTPPIRPKPRQVSPSQAPQPLVPATPKPSVSSPPQQPTPVAPQTTSPTSPSVTPTPPPSPVMPPAAPPRPEVVFNFDNADIYEVIRVMAEILKFNYIIDPKVKGVVNIHTSGQISVADVFPIFQSILRLNGATAVKRDGVYEIVPLVDAKKLPIPPSTTLESGKPPSGDRYAIQIVSLKYIPAAEVSKMIKPFLSDGADIVEHPPNNILIIGDLASNVKKSLDIINLFDLDIFTDLRVRIYPILNADVTEVAKEMERIFTSFEVSTKSGRGVGITFTPITRINSLLVVSSIPNIFQKVEGWLKELDKIPMEGSKPGVFVYYVQNAKAKDLAEVLKDVFVKGREKKEKEKGAAPAETVPRGVSVKPPPSTPTPAPKEEGTAVPEGEINIVVDETTNSLIIKAFQRDYRNILETIKKLDIYPKQVLFETLLASIKLDDTTKFGIEWARFISSNPPNAQEVTLMGRPPTDPFTLAAAATPQAGIKYSIVELGGRVAAAISAAATNDRVNVISSPHILASNNKEAKIQIGSSQPILTSTYTTPGVTSTTGAGTVEGTIEYKDIGTILTLTPRISDSGLITLEIQVEQSDVSLTTLGTYKDSIPVFDKKIAKTVLSVLEGQTIVIGGMIENRRIRNKSGIPILSRIPILGALFGVQNYEAHKTELVLLLTPHIITDHIQSRTVTEEFREKVEGLKKELEKERMKKEEK